jgi:hypothetical protein
VLRILGWLPQDRKAAALAFSLCHRFLPRVTSRLSATNKANQKVSTAFPSGPGWDQLSLIYKWIEQDKTDAEIKFF